MESKVLRSMKLLGGLIVGSFFSLNAVNLGNYKNAVITGTINATTLIDNGGDSINLDNLVEVDGPVTLKASAGCLLDVNIGTDMTVGTNATVIRPRLLAEGAGNDNGQIIFEVESGAEIHVNINADTFFAGGNYSTSAVSLAAAQGAYVAASSRDAVLTVLGGEGSVYFHITGGAKVAFDSLFKVTGGSINADTARFELNDGTVALAKGTKLYTTMDQNTDNINIPKVTFDRGLFDAGETVGSLDATVRIGCDSTVAFLSNDYTGDTEDHNAHMAFDVSNYWYGRLVLEIAGGTQDGFHDGAFLMYGSGLNNDFSIVSAYINDVQLRYFAGLTVLVSVIDDLARQEGLYQETLLLTEENQFPYYVDFDTNELSRRGLLVVNQCNSTNPFAANTFGDFDYRTNHAGKPFTVRDSQVGCVLGVNGTLNIAHNTFFDYLATRQSIGYDPAAMGLDNLGSSPDDFKRRSPGALIIDGCDFSGGTISGSFNSVSRALVYMQGQSAMYVRCCANDFGVYNGDYSTGSGQYDGTVVSHGNLSGFNDGHMALDVAGEAIMYHTTDPDYDPEEWGIGQFNVPSLLLDGVGREIYSGGNLVSRPLINGDTYDTYQRSYVNLNNDLHCVNMVLNHSSVLHNVPRDQAGVQPAIVGGEAASWYGDSELLPFLDLSNSWLSCHESLGLSGLRVLVHDAFGLLDTFGQSDPEFSYNNSAIICYNQGDDNDTANRGWARVLALGSNNNQIYTGATDEFLDSAFVHVYRDHNQFDDGELPVQLRLDALPEPEVFWATSYAFDTTQEGWQVVGLYNDSYAEVGWRTQDGFFRFDGTFIPQNAFPWNTNGGDSFSNDLNENQAAELFIAGNGFAFEGFDRLGNESPSIVTGSALPGVMYVEYGGRLTIAQTNPENPASHALFNLPVATLGFPTSEGALLYGEVDLPSSQVDFGHGYAMNPYNINMNDFSPLYLDLAQLFADQGNEVLISWNNITQSTDFLPVKSAIAGLSLDQFKSPKKAAAKKAVTRATVPVITPVELPLAMLSVGADYYLDQLQVAGASSMSPFHFYMTGDDLGYSQIRELVSFDTIPFPVLGEGMHGALFLDQGARLGLGSRSWNENSVNAWNILGDNQVTLYPNGDCVIELNSDLIINDLNAIIPTTNFGDVPAGQSHRITFLSKEGHAVRVPAGSELDLSAFGQSTLLNGGDGVNSQQIAFAGNAKLIFEPGSTLRFPSDIDFARGPILYMNEESELLFEPIKERNKPAADALAQLDKYRVKIKGIGQIWLNKNAKMKVFEEAMVGVESDDVRTPFTYLQMSLQRDAQMLIGDENNKGGSFQVGNPFELADNNIVFSLRINGADTLVNIDRYGFYGLGAGILAQPEDAVNTWRLVALHNVIFTEMLVIDGTFSHNQIFDGSGEGEGSLFAVGQAEEHDLIIGAKVDNRQPVIRGGGNVILVTFDATEADYLIPDIQNSAVELIGDSLEDNGRYNILGSTQIIQQKEEVQIAGFADISVIDDLFPEVELRGGSLCAADPSAFFQYICHLPVRHQTPKRTVSFGINDGQQRHAYLEGDFNQDANIVRSEFLALLAEYDVDRASAQGYLQVATVDSEGDAAVLRSPRQQ